MKTQFTGEMRFWAWMAGIATLIAILEIGILLGLGARDGLLTSIISTKSMFVIFFLTKARADDRRRRSTEESVTVLQDEVQRLREELRRPS